MTGVQTCALPIWLAQKALLHCRAKGISLEQLAVAFSVHNPRIATTLFSTTNKENLLKTLSYANTPIDHEMVAEVQALFAPGFRDTWVNS